MLKQASVTNSLRARVEGVDEVDVPAGVCWVIEGKMWATLIWREGDASCTAELPIRQYETLKADGQIRFDVRRAERTAATPATALSPIELGRRVDYVSWAGRQAAPG